MPPANRGRRAAAFVVLVTVLTLGAWVPIIVTGADAYAMPAFALFGLGAFAPTVAALALARLFDGPASAVALGRSIVDWRRVSRTAAVIALAALLVVPVAALCAVLAGAPVALPGRDAWATLGAVSLAVLMGPVNEEAGWVGWLDPALEGAAPSALALAGGSAARLAWHLPLFVMAGTDQRAAAFLPFAAGIVALHVLAVAATRASRGAVAAAVLVHAAWNAGIALIPLTGPAYILRAIAALALAAGAMRWTASGTRWIDASAVPDAGRAPRSAPGRNA